MIRTICLLVFYLFTLAPTNSKADVAEVFGNTIQIKSRWCAYGDCSKTNEKYYFSKDGSKLFLRDKDYGEDGVLYLLGKKNCSSKITTETIEGDVTKFEFKACGLFLISGNKITIKASTLRSFLGGDGVFVEFQYVFHIPKPGSCRLLKISGKGYGEGDEFTYKATGTCQFLTGRKL